MASYYAIIENGIVVNRVVAEEDIANQNGWILCPEGGIGWSYANGTFTPPAAPEPTQVPTPTKEQLLAQLQELQAKIQALE